MDSPFRVQRRRLLGSLVGSLVVAIGPSGCSEDPPSPRDEHVRAVLRAYFQLEAHPEIRVVGDTAQMQPWVGEPTRSLQLIEGTASIEDAVEALEVELLTDFDQGRMTTVGGWQLAELEAELLALVVLTGV